MFKGKKSKVKTLKTGVPKARDLKEYESIISMKVDNLEHLTNVFVNAIPEIGRKLAKAGGYEYGKNSLMSTLAVASSLNEATESIAVTRYHEQRLAYADFNGYSDEPWQSIDNCGNVIRGDFQDLYESPQYEVIIRVVAPVKDKEKLCKHGVK
jgi:hypothetical protein